jgi:hypothetical protein
LHAGCGGGGGGTFSAAACGDDCDLAHFDKPRRVELEDAEQVGARESGGGSGVIDSRERQGGEDISEKEVRCGRVELDAESILNRAEAAREWEGARVAGGDGRQVRLLISSATAVVSAEQAAGDVADRTGLLHPVREWNSAVLRGDTFDGENAAPEVVSLGGHHRLRGAV